MKKTLPKSVAREATVKFLYQCDILDVFYFSNTHFSEFCSTLELEAETRAYTSRLCEGTLSNLSKLDKTITDHATRWNLGRIGFMDRAILRAATYELNFTDVPKKVVLNEAIELAKKFGENNSRRFINGVLAAIAEKKD